MREATSLQFFLHLVTRNSCSDVVVMLRHWKARDGVCLCITGDFVFASINQGDLF
jgi:hypothetical protein